MCVCVGQDSPLLLSSNRLEDENTWSSITASTQKLCVKGGVGLGKYFDGKRVVTADSGNLLLFDGRQVCEGLLDFKKL